MNRIAWLGLLVAACGHPVSLENHPCPCTDGYICCAPSQSCVNAVAGCPGPPADGTPPAPDAAPPDAPFAIPDVAPPDAHPSPDRTLLPANELTTDVWTPISAAGAPTSDELRSTMVWTGKEAIVWGEGRGAAYDPATDAWRPLPTLRGPSMRQQHSAVWTGTEMLVWGGQSANPNTTTGGARYNPATDAWRPVSQLDAPPPIRAGATGTWTGTSMLYYGGEVDDVSYGGAYLYDGAADGWRHLLDAPLPRGAHQAAWDGEEVLIWSGVAGPVGLTFEYSGLAYAPAGNSWRALATTDAPTTAGTAVWAAGAGSRKTGLLLVEGGERGGAAYDPGSDQWFSTTRQGAPHGEWRLAVWTGQELIVWNQSNGGARYRP